eukprot:TRINITY_DN3849_c1_g1_i1.p3 TRINITY_DN3849_c1_g1~~TRINITY_DN3849_c1_g1_i1.p3  ORF type:complete len:190 (-),score=3.23 TRINITY_DN3849_c1_g1_i1:197-766(-)
MGSISQTKQNLIEEHKSMNQRTGLLIAQSIVAGLTVVYLLLALITFGNIQQSGSSCFYKENSYMNGVLVACFLSVVVSILYIVFSIPILLNRCCRQKVEATFAWGILMTATAYSSLFYLLSGFTISMMDGKVLECLEKHKQFSSNDGNVMQATYILAYILAASYLVMFVVFTSCRSAFKAQPPMASQTV